MSGGRFLGSAVAAREGAYFLQQSKNAVGDLISRGRLPAADHSKKLPNPGAHNADVLPEVLRHSLPISPSSPPPPPSFSSFSKWALSSSSSTSPCSSLNPISGHISLPQVTFGPRRWDLPESRQSVTASTANELRADRYSSRMNPEKMRAAAAGLAQVGKAFVVATILVFGGATCAFMAVTSKLRVQTSDDLRVKAHDLLQPKVEMFKDQVVPLQAWVESLSRKWHIEGGEDIKERPMVKELSKRLGGKSPN